MALTRWFKRIVKGTAEESTHMGAHFVRVLVLLLLEIGVSWILALPQLKSVAPLAEPVLKYAIPVTILIFCLHLVFILALNAWDDIRSRLQTRGQDWRTATGIIVFVAAVSGAVVFFTHSPGSPTLSALNAKTVAAQEIARLDLTEQDKRSGPQGAWRFAPSVGEVELLFQVAVEEGFVYMAQIDGREAAMLGFRAEGLFTHHVPPSSLHDGRHHLAVYRSKFGDKPSLTLVRDIIFEIQNGN
jgi:hypothetical protein